MSSPAPLPAAQPAAPGGSVLQRLLTDSRRRERATHVEHLPPRPAGTADWPGWLPEELVAAWERCGIAAPWRHQVEMAEQARAGRHVVIATGTASGKSLGYLMPALTAAVHEAGAVLYLSPTKALAADQLRNLGELRIDGLRAATIDGDCNDEEREWARRHAAVVLTNPDMLHRSLLPRHERWATFWRHIRYVVVDECHAYRGVFGAHVAMVLRRLRRVAARHGSRPVFLLASATLAQPEVSAERLIGLPVVPVVDDCSPRGRMDVALWEPPLLPASRGSDPSGTDSADQPDQPVRRTATAEAAELLADLVCDGVRSVAFVRSRRAAESVAITARQRLAQVAPELADRVAAYRAGFLAEERRHLERALHSGRLLGLASTNALELGVDVSGLDAVLIAGWPGTRVSLWQQAGRAGRSGGDATAVFIGRDDPLDTYLLQHPDAVFGAPLEAMVLDPDNPYVLAPHLAAAAAELPITPDDAAAFGPAADAVLDDLVAARLLRRRPAGWFWTGRDRACDLVDLRGGEGPPVRICEAATGRLLGTVDAAAAPATVHDGAVYLHQGESYVVDTLDLDDSVALVHAERPDWTTSARTLTNLSVVTTTTHTELRDGVGLALGTVDVTTQVTGFLRRRLGSGEVLGEQPLDLPPRDLPTTAVWWTVTPELTAAAEVPPADLPGALHAAEHASIGLLPLIATCDRWDVGGLSTDCHPDTGLPTVFVYDGHPGGAGFAARGHDRFSTWLTATLDVVRGCRCEAGCPACVQSPKCGNGNEPLAKAAAARVLAAVLATGD